MAQHDWLRLRLGCANTMLDSLSLFWMMSKVERDCVVPAWTKQVALFYARRMLACKSSTYMLSTRRLARSAQKSSHRSFPWETFLGLPVWRHAYEGTVLT